MEGAVEGRTDDWGQVVTRYPYENVGMDHLLSKEKDVRETSEDSRENSGSVLRDHLVISHITGQGVSKTVRQRA